LETSSTRYILVIGRVKGTNEIILEWMRRSLAVVKGVGLGPAAQSCGPPA